MISIWKYEVEPDIVNQIVTMQQGAQIISFGLDPADKLCVWALVDTEARTESRLMACVGTGWDVAAMFGPNGDREVSFIGTATRGAYVWHLFDLGVSRVSDIPTSSIEEASRA